MEVGGAAACADVDLVARSAARIVGVVVDARGNRSRTSRSHLFTPPYNPFRRDFHHLLAGSDDSGRFGFVDVPPGIYQAGVGVPEPAEYRPFAPVLAQGLADGRRELRVGLGEVVELAPLVARRVDPVTVHGVVTGMTGVSLYGLDIVVGAVEAGEAGGIGVGRTDAEGRFTAELDPRCSLSHAGVVSAIGSPSGSSSSPATRRSRCGYSRSAEGRRGC